MKAEPTTGWHTHEPKIQPVWNEQGCCVVCGLIVRVEWELAKEQIRKRDPDHPVLK